VGVLKEVASLRRINELATPALQAPPAVPPYSLERCAELLRADPESCLRLMMIAQGLKVRVLRGRARAKKAA
jgi:hypothetical protein